MSCSQPELLFQEIVNVKKLLVICEVFFLHFDTENWEEPLNISHPVNKHWDMTEFHRLCWPHWMIKCAKRWIHPFYFHFCLNHPSSSLNGFFFERLALFQGTTSAKCWWSTPGGSCAEPSSTSVYPTFQLGVGHSFNIFSSKNECHLCELHCEGKGQGESQVGLPSSSGLWKLAGLSIMSYRIHRKFAPFFVQIFAKKFVKCKNLHK